MEGKNQNLEFSQKLDTNSEECLEERSTNLFNMRPLCASGGDMVVAATDILNCNSKNSSYQNLSSSHQIDKSKHSNIDDGDVMRQFQCNVASLLEGSCMNVCDNTKRKKYKNDIGSQLKAELSKYKKELMVCNDTTKDLEEKYLKINYELNDIQEKHNRFVEQRKKSINDIEIYSDSSSCSNSSSCSSSNSSSNTGSQYSLKRKYTQVFHRGSSFLTIPQPPSNSSNEKMSVHSNLVNEDDKSYEKKISKQTILSEMHLVGNSPHCISGSHTAKRKHSARLDIANKENESPQICQSHHKRRQAAGLKDIYKVLKNALDSNQHHAHSLMKDADLKGIQTTINNLQTEQAQFRSIIQRQQNCLQNYHARCLKAQEIIQTQYNEIQKLNSNNEQLETEISAGIDQLRVKIDSKLRDVSHLPAMMREERAKCEKGTKEKRLLTERISTLQAESEQLKLKLDDLGRRKGITLARLKTAERDLKIFKNYNTSLKLEKRQLSEELQKTKEHLDNMQASNKKALARQREQYEKQRRDLQKRVFELELKLNRSQNTTTSHIQERDSLIAELQTQLNTLVHNFEVSQKHIRVLRRHIYTMSSGSAQSNTRCRINAAI